MTQEEIILKITKQRIVETIIRFGEQECNNFNLNLASEPLYDFKYCPIPEITYGLAINELCAEGIIERYNPRIQTIGMEHVLDTCYKLSKKTLRQLKLKNLINSL